MTTNNQGQRQLKFVAAALGLTAIVMATTALAFFYMTSAPRGMMFWLSTGFCCAIEFMFGIWVLNILARSRCDYRPSGATLSITFVCIGALAISGLLGILIYGVARDADGARDRSFMAILAAIAVFWFVVAFVVYAYDIYVQTRASPSLQNRAEHKNLARTISPLISMLRIYRTGDDDQRKRVYELLKKLESIGVALEHSHGGGSGSSWEGRKQNLLNEKGMQDIRDKVEQIDEIAKLLTSPGQQVKEVRSCLESLELLASKLRYSLEALELR